MSTPNKLNIGLFGFGVVGESLWQVLQKNTSLHATISKVCIKHIAKERNAPSHLFTNAPEDILNDPEINVIVELIDDADAAYSIVTYALKNGKSVVSANKKMIANHLQELLDIQQQTNTALLYEAACCASIPVVRNLEEYYDNDLLQSINGIVNGSTNYILTKIADEGLTFNAANKLTILLAHAYGIVSSPANITYTGIDQIDEYDARYAREKGFEIKLSAHAHKLDNGLVAAFVLPQFIKKDNSLFYVKNEYNGVVIESALADKQFFTGKGAGGFPTASAVISDLSALRYNYKYEYKKRFNQEPSVLSNDFFVRAYISLDTGTNIPHEIFENIEEWASTDRRSYVVGTVHFSKLAENRWWQKKGVSLILLPEAISRVYKTRIRKDARHLATV